jgi:predicted GNAT superfamily acetyltransferase
MGDEITIRRAETVGDYHACQRVQRLAWGIADESYIVPIATMVGAQHHGGLVLGAFESSGEAVGVSFAFLGRIEGRICLYSQLTGVLPVRQSLGLGYRLKMAQRELALAEGVSLIAWAFDPLQAGNARFNLQKLGASARRYIDDMYGPRTDSLNAGVPTDRLIAEWDLSGPDREATGAEDSAALPRLIDSSEQADGQRAPITVETADGGRVLLEIPDDIRRLRARDAALAERWRQAVRNAMTTAFASGYRAVGFLRDESEGDRRSFYVLKRRSEELPQNGARGRPSQGVAPGS